MEIQRFTYPAQFRRLSGDILGFDLEMANSFSDRPGVICMIGMEHYEPESGHSVSTIGSVTDPQQEAELIAWFMERLGHFRGRHERPKLLSFSGLDNDIPWINERLQRYGMAEGEGGVLAHFEHIDLKREFYRRTHNSRISLKKLEEVFGIRRDSSITSKKVSFTLTGILRRSRDQARIPETLYQYLREDVHHLLLIYDRWPETSLDHHNLTETEYLNSIASLLKLAQRLTTLSRLRHGSRREHDALQRFADELEHRLQAAVADGGFETFGLPTLPELRTRHNDVERLRKKFRALQDIHTVDRKTGVYRLAKRLHRPKGALAVVRDSGRLLMIRRADDLERAAGYWGLPGGLLEPGERPAEAARRELAEEVGLHGSNGQILGSSNSISGEYELIWVEVFVDDVTTLRLREREVAEARWITPREVHELRPLVPGAIEGFREFLGADWQGVRLPAE